MSFILMNGTFYLAVRIQHYRKPLGGTVHTMTAAHCCIIQVLQICPYELDTCQHAYILFTHVRSLNLFFNIG